MRATLFFEREIMIFPSLSRSESIVVAVAGGVGGGISYAYLIEESRREGEKTLCGRQGSRNIFASICQDGQFIHRRKLMFRPSLL